VLTLPAEEPAVTISGRMTIYGWSVVPRSGQSSAWRPHLAHDPPERPLLCFVRNGRGPVSAGSSEDGGQDNTES
jgi:hypothetical protein